MAVYAPIYKDTIYTYQGEELEYRIEFPLGTVIYEGTASERPDGTPIKIYMNRLCEPYLAQKLNPVVTGITQQPAVGTFYLFNSLNDNLLETYYFLRMYSGEWDGEDKVLSDPIGVGVSPQMVLPFSVYTKSGATINIEAVPIVRNTFFNLITDFIYVIYEGTNYIVRYNTDYYPYQSITPVVVSGDSVTITSSNKSSTGMTISFGENPSFSEKHFTIGFRMENGPFLPGTIECVQEGEYFELSQDTLTVFPEGGTFIITYDTSLPDSRITAGIMGLPSATVEKLGGSMVQVTVPPTPVLDDIYFTIVFSYYNGDTLGLISGTLMAGGDYSGSTKVYISGLPVQNNGVWKVAALINSEPGCVVSISDNPWLKVEYWDASFQDPNPPYGTKTYTKAELRTKEDTSTVTPTGTSVTVLFSKASATTAVTVEVSVSYPQSGTSKSQAQIISNTAVTQNLSGSWSGEHFNVDGAEVVFSQSFPGGYVENYGKSDNFSNRVSSTTQDGKILTTIKFPYNANSITVIGFSTATDKIMTSLSASTCDGFRLETSSANTTFEEVGLNMTAAQFLSLRTTDATVWESVMPMPYKFAPWGHKILSNEQPQEVLIKTSDNQTITITGS